MTPEFKLYAKQVRATAESSHARCPLSDPPRAPPPKHTPPPCADTAPIPSACLQVITNARALAAALVAKGYVMATGGTDNHLVLWDLRPLGLTGSKLEKLCDEVRSSLRTADACSGNLRGAQASVCRAAFAPRPNSVLCARAPTHRCPSR